MTFYLKNPERKSETLIMASYHFDGKRIKFSTGEQVHPSYWNALKHRCRASAPNAILTNRLLDEIEERVRRVHLTMKADFIHATIDSLKSAILMDLRTDGKRENLVQFFERFIEESRPKRKSGSLSVYQSAYKIVKEFPGGKDFGDINPQWFARLQVHMEGCRSRTEDRDGFKRQIELPNGYSANYIGKTVAIIREVMTIAKKQGLHKNDAYKDTDYRRPKEDVDSIYLRVDELMAMHKASLPDGYAKVRDRFLLSAFTGLRYSDVSKITNESIRGGYLYDRNKKTNTDVVIPIHPVVREIMDRYPDGLPRPISNQKFNDMIKEVGRRAGIDTLVEKHSTKGGQQITMTVPKYTLITSHTGRRSAITNMVLAGIPITQIMKISGHRTTASFLKYVRTDGEQNARTIQSHPFFSGE